MSVCGWSARRLRPDIGAFEMAYNELMTLKGVMPREVVGMAIDYGQFAPSGVSYNAIYVGDWIQGAEQDDQLRGASTWEDGVATTANSWIAMGSRAYDGGVYSSDWRTADYLVTHWKYNAADDDYFLTVHIHKSTTEGTGDYAGAYRMLGVNVINPSGARWTELSTGAGLPHMTWALSDKATYDAQEQWVGPLQPPGIRPTPLPVFCEVVAIPNLIVSGSISLVTGNQNLAVVRMRYDERVYNFSEVELEERDYLISSITTDGRRVMELVLAADIISG